MAEAPQSMFRDGAKDDTNLYEDDLPDDVTTAGATISSNITAADILVLSSLLPSESGPGSSFSGLSGSRK